MLICLCITRNFRCQSEDSYGIFPYITVMSSHGRIIESMAILVSKSYFEFLLLCD